MKSRLAGMNVFAEVVGAKSFSAAADKLGISKSLASREVSALERSLAVKLLKRPVTCPDCMPRPIIWPVVVARFSIGPPDPSSSSN